MKDEPEEIQQKLCRQDRGGACGVIIRGHFDQINTNNLVTLCNGFEHFQYFIVEKPTMGRRASPGGDGGAKRVNVDGHIDPHIWWYMGQHAPCAHLAHLTHADDIRAEGAGGIIAFLGGGTDIADAHLGQARHIGLLGGAAHGVAVAVAHAVAFVHEIQMGVDLQDVNVTLPVKGADAGDIYRMIAADHHGQGGSIKGSAHTCLDIGMAGLGICMNDVCIAHVDDVHFPRQVGYVVLMVIRPRMAETEQGRSLAYTARPESCARTVLCPRIKRRAEDRHIRVQRGPVRLVPPFAKGRDAYKRQVEPAAFIPVFAHHGPLLFAQLWASAAQMQALAALSPFQSGISMR